MAGSSGRNGASEQIDPPSDGIPENVQPVLGDPGMNAAPASQYETHSPLNALQKGAVAVFSALGALRKCVSWNSDDPTLRASILAAPIIPDHSMLKI